MLEMNNKTFTSRLARELPRPSGSGGTNQDGGEEDDGNELGGLCL